MNVKQLVAKLKSLAGYHIAVVGNAVNRTQSCVEVRQLHPDERQDNQDNVILHNGILGLDGAPSGLTIRASDVQEVTWITPTTVTLTGKNSETATIAILYKLRDDDNPP